MQKLFEGWRKFLKESITINGIPINVEIANNPESRSSGLMHRKELSNDSGMLFCFPNQEPRSFWMKNTEIPLSIAYADDGGQIINIEDMQPFDQKGARSHTPASYALEMNQGWFNKNNIFPGDKLEGISFIKSK